MSEEQPVIEFPVDPQKERLRRAVRYFYDTQQLRIASGNRTADPADYKMVPDKKDPTKEKKVKKNVSRAQMDAALMEVLISVRGNQEHEVEDDGKERPAPPTLEEEDRQYLRRQNYTLLALEVDTLDRIKGILKPMPIADWLLTQKGCGPTMTGVIISEINIHKCNTPSALWAYAGLHTDAQTGKAVRRQRGVKANWNSFLKTKLVKVLAECFIKANSPWRSHYDNYKMRKTNELVKVCMLCEGSGKMSAADEDEIKKLETPDLDEALEALAADVVNPDATKKTKTCINCKGTGGNCSWGRSGAHRDQAAKRYMIKAFLLQFWMEWRQLEGLPITESYAVAILGREHGDHGGAGVANQAPKINPRTQEPYRPAPRNAHP